MTRFKLHTIFLLILYLVGLSLIYGQEQDTVKLKKLFHKGEAFENTLPDSAIYYYGKVIELTKTTPNQKIVGLTYNRFATLVHDKKGDIKKSFDLNFKALKIFEVIKDSGSIAQISENIGIALVELRRYDEAIHYHKIALSYSEKLKQSSVLISSAMSIADCYSSLFKMDSAIYYMKELENHFPKDASKTSLSLFYSNVGNTYYNIGETTGSKADFQLAINYAEKAKNLCLDFNLDEIDLAFAYGLIGASYMALNKYDEAETNYIKAIAIFEKHKDNFNLNQMYFELTLLYIKMGDKEKAQSYFYKHDDFSKLLYNEENSNSVSSMKTQFETEKKETENKFLQTQNNLSNKTIKQQQLISYFIVGGLLIVSCLAFFIFSGLKKQRHANRIISQQKIVVEEKHKEITDSIHYAQRIQRALITPEKYIDNQLNKLNKNNG